MLHRSAGIIGRRLLLGGLRRAQTAAPRAPSMALRAVNQRGLHWSRAARLADKGGEGKDGAAEEAKEEAAADETAADNGAAEEVNPLQARVEDLEGEVKKMTEAVQVALAEAENARSIAKRDVSSARDFAITKFAKSLLDVADNFTRALEAVDTSEEADARAQLTTLMEGSQWNCPSAFDRF